MGKRTSTRSKGLRISPYENDGYENTIKAKTIERCQGPLQARLVNEPQGMVHCGFRIDPEVFVGKITWKRSGESEVNLHIEVFSINPQTGALEGRLDIHI